MRRRSAMRNRNGSAVLVWLVVVMAVASGYVASKYVAVPMMVSYRAAVAERQTQDETQGSEQGGETTEQPPADEAEKQEADTDKSKEEKSSTGVVTGQQDIPDEAKKEAEKDAVKETSVTAQAKEASSQPEALSGLYCIQFGSFSTRNAAETTISDLAGKNISSFIKEKDGVFKVYSIPYETKEKAKAAAAGMAGAVPDMFVVGI